MAKKQKRTSRPKKAVRKNSMKNVTFSYKDPSGLERFMTEQGAIVPRAETGLSQKQQRRLGIAIKRARHLALLPFTQTL